MARFPSYMTEFILSVIAFFWLWFVLTNANINLGNAYLWAVVISVVLLFLNILIFDRNVRITFQKSPGHQVEAFFSGVVGWVVLLMTSFAVLKFVEPAKASFYSIVSSFGAANPAFSNSQIVNFITVSFAIGYAETTLFARAMEFIADLLHIPLNKENRFRIGFVMLAIGLSLAFAAYHFTAKGVQATASLILVAIMMFLSLVMIVTYGETRQAVWMHIISNGAAGAMLMLSGGLMFN